MTWPHSPRDQTAYARSAAQECPKEQLLRSRQRPRNPRMPPVSFSTCRGTRSHGSNAKAPCMLHQRTGSHWPWSTRSKIHRQRTAASRRRQVPLDSLPDYQSSVVVVTCCSVFFSDVFARQHAHANPLMSECSARHLFVASRARSTLRP